MRYVVDTSAIINLTEKLSDEVIDVFKESMTVDLAYYEIGNFLWKVGKTHLLEDFINILKFLKIESIGLSDEVLTFAMEERITYYDAAYLFLSRKYNLTLISDDQDLINKGAKRTSDILTQ
ncbi:PIN domain nuclease [Candidatus Marsarchaeota G2 archaeon OSP_D]|jgi:predicted nucleic acid-binding protein|uniref:PIN domain nuclease n=6 Tax=Candidatus Marsarchaeota group 2 TaxID=2203771 RepID=A0A2R6C8M6_9ARCH|nr:MAG: PIN domain nuclease [Candidatus Marsarchaeota G2 archaeon ECH_B_SAG-M15]PSN92468.1 MAG: PIN domain nuclease [Candidatus Marsarchaeota G2 archaeon OSP_D]PSN94825.1 MAG: PIN domain nuclease [Candidatus Marsarchaeota G2 archaeon ECH_B_SAG-C16]PSN95319.1 MAG: PIN domain nuclease [Candidatus Marsarchaeota G2 archaeon ECH_B_2]PSO02140.1 MAG: PIN domain nuclease [Candidatus Marsarchaeota G2 archaeon ECH_B_1]PSO07255.1 MAG: PIN domain nuclease [Candidatus Marsarchaeota G2 archaeon BE_D]